MRVRIDPNRCTGHAKCWAAVPELFEVDDEGFGFVILDVVPAELEDRARAAIQNCPERAIFEGPQQ